jgi:hypothetical protein
VVGERTSWCLWNERVEVKKIGSSRRSRVESGSIIGTVRT